MTLQSTTADISVIVTVASIPGATAATSPTITCERRISPAWTVSTLKAKLETMTGIPPGSQRLKLKSPGKEDEWVDGDDQLVGDWLIRRGCEFEVHDTRPPSDRLNFADLSSVEKYTLPKSAYEALPNTVLSWKRSQKLGRFDPNAVSVETMVKKQVEKDEIEIKQRGIQLSDRAIILPSSPPHIRRGTVRFIGAVPSIPSPTSKAAVPPFTDSAPLWIGIELDEPTGKNDGSIGGERYFTCPDKRGLFVKPEKVEVGDFPPLDVNELDDMEEI